MIKASSWLGLLSTYFVRSSSYRGYWSQNPNSAWRIKSQIISPAGRWTTWKWRAAEQYKAGCFLVCVDVALSPPLALFLCEEITSHCGLAICQIRGLLMMTQMSYPRISCIFDRCITPQRAPFFSSFVTPHAMMVRWVEVFYRVYYRVRNQSFYQRLVA